jgi:hypothetical protein
MEHHVLQTYQPPFNAIWRLAMSIIGQLAASLGRRDEVPNQILAKLIADNHDTWAVQELIDNLANKDKAIQNDCIKTLYEIAMLKPELVAGHAKVFIALLASKNNRQQWGAMTAIDHITNNCPTEVYAALAKIIAVADAGSVITNDHCVGILIKLCAIDQYADDAFALLNERLLKSPVNQFPMYAENALPAISEKYKPVFIKTLITRLPDLKKESQTKRVEKVLRKIHKK